MSADPRPLGGLYVHIPFCSAICPYCDFAVLTAREARRDRFHEVLGREIESWRDTPDLPEIDTVYFGGGTPSLLRDEQIQRIGEGLRHALPISADAKIFMEANPEDVTPSRLQAWVELGVHFLSLGVQSLQDDALRFLGRRHSAAEALRSVEGALEAGIHTVSMDLIFGLPDRAVGDLERDIDEAAALGLHHISCYQLTVHEGTHFARRREQGSLVELAEESQGDRYLLLHKLLEQAGFAAYEVSNFAIDPSHRSAHNSKYWNHTPYLGLGPSAHSFLERRRWWNHRSLDDWENALERTGSAVEGEEILSESQLATEAVLLGMRRAEGVSPKGLRAEYGVQIDRDTLELLDEMKSRGYVEYRGGHYCPTASGMAISDRLALDLCRSIGL